MIAGLSVIAARAVHARRDARLELFQVERQLIHACHLLPFGFDAPKRVCELPKGAPYHQDQNSTRMNRRSSRVSTSSARRLPQ